MVLTLYLVIPLMDVGLPFVFPLPLPSPLRSSVPHISHCLPLPIAPTPPSPTVPFPGWLKVVVGLLLLVGDAHVLRCVTLTLPLYLPTRFGYRIVPHPHSHHPHILHPISSPWLLGIVGLLFPLCLCWALLFTVGYFTLYGCNTVLVQFGSLTTLHTTFARRYLVLFGRWIFYYGWLLPLPACHVPRLPWFTLLYCLYLCWHLIALALVPTLYLAFVVVYLCLGVPDRQTVAFLPAHCCYPLVLVVCCFLPWLTSPHPTPCSCGCCVCVCLWPPPHPTPFTCTAWFLYTWCPTLPPCPPLPLPPPPPCPHLYPHCDLLPFLYICGCTCLHFPFPLFCGHICHLWLWVGHPLPTPCICCLPITYLPSCLPFLWLVPVYFVFIYLTFGTTLVGSSSFPFALLQLPTGHLFTPFIIITVDSSLYYCIWFDRHDSCSVGPFPTHWVILPHTHSHGSLRWFPPFPPHTHTWPGQLPPFPWFPFPHLHMPHTVVVVIPLYALPLPYYSSHYLAHPTHLPPCLPTPSSWLVVGLITLPWHLLWLPTPLTPLCSLWFVAYVIVATTLWLVILVNKHCGV